MKNLVSIDFDFFVREDPMWDFGHSEENAVFANVAWQARYGTIDLYKETDMAKYANFPPEKMMTELFTCNFKLGKNYNLWVAESHKDAYTAVKSLGKCVVYNFDAHHDMWQDKLELNCGNWLVKGIEDGYVKGVNWVAPDWSSEWSDDDTYWFKDGQHPEIQGWYYDAFKKKRKRGNKIEIDGIFICRSSAWVPPHFDKDFLSMAKLFSAFTRNAEVLGKMYERKAPTPKEAQKLLEEYSLAVKDLMKKQNLKPEEVSIGK